MHVGPVGQPQLPAGGDRAEQQQGLGPGEALADAVADALPEREERGAQLGPGVVGGPAAGVEVARVAVQPRVAVERVRAEHHPGARREQVAAQFDVGQRPAGQDPHRAVEPQRLGDHGAGVGQRGQDAVGFLLQPQLDLGVPGQQVAGPGDGVPGRLGARDHQRGDLVPELPAAHPGAGFLVAGPQQDRDQVAVVRARRLVAVDDAVQQGPQPPPGGGEPAVGPGRHPAQPGHVGGDALGHQLGQQHAEQPLDLVDHLGADIAGQQRPGQHGERDGAQLAVERERSPVWPRADPRQRDFLHRVQVAGDLRPVKGGLQQAPLPAVALALRHHQPVPDQRLGPAEAEALLQLPGLAGQRLADGVGAVQQVQLERPEPDPDHVAVLPGPLQQRERVAAELGGMPQQPPPARHHRDIGGHNTSLCCRFRRRRAGQPALPGRTRPAS